MIARLFATLIILLAFTTPAHTAGTIFGLPLSIQVDEDGVPLSGAKLFLFDANSSSPRDSFADFGLSEGQELSHPIEADAAGRLPQFWVADGAYRVRLTTAAGVEVFDHASVTAIGPSTGGEGGEGGGVDETAVFSTGDFLWQPIAGTRTGWVRANGRTIGSAASGATERANADTGPLYEWLWNNFSDANAPVSGGRGANAAADFDANKAIGVIDMRGRAMLGLDTMGATAAGVAPGVEDAAETGGDDVSTALIAHTHSDGTFAVASHTHTGPSHTHDISLQPVTFNDSAWVNNVTKSTANVQGGGGATVIDEVDGNVLTFTATVSGVTVSAGTGATGGTAPDVTGATGSTGSGVSFSIMPPFRAGSIYLKL